MITPPKKAEGKQLALMQGQVPYHHKPSLQRGRKKQFLTICIHMQDKFEKTTQAYEQ